MGTGDRPAAVHVDGGVGRGAEHDLAEQHAAGVHDHTRHRLLHVADLDDRAGVQPDPAVVGELAAALGVERGAVEDELDLVALGGGRSAGTPSTSRPTTVASPSVRV